MLTRIPLLRLTPKASTTLRCCPTPLILIVNETTAKVTLRPRGTFDIIFSILSNVFRKGFVPSKNQPLPQRPYLSKLVLPPTSLKIVLRLCQLLLILSSAALVLALHLPSNLAQVFSAYSNLRFGLTAPASNLFGDWNSPFPAFGLLAWLVWLGVALVLLKLKTSRYTYLLRPHNLVPATWQNIFIVATLGGLILVWFCW